MKKKKYYAIDQGRGRTPDIVEDWSACKERVDKEAGAVYKAFKKKEEAVFYLALLRGLGARELLERYPYLAPGVCEEALEKETGLVYTPPKKTQVEVYVDGSFQENTQAYGYGYVIIKDGQVLEEKAGYGDKADAVLLRNVAGEMLGAVQALKRVHQLGYKSVSLHFDYQGIESWARGLWKRNNKHTQAYHAFMQKMSRQLDIVYVKVSAHSGDTYNDLADKLAKEGVTKARHDHDEK